MKKYALALVIVGLVVFGVFLLAGGGGNAEGKNAFIECLKDEGVTIYGSLTCPACAQMASEFGGYNVIRPIYVECTVESRRCDQEMVVSYVPAVQIDGVLLDEPPTPENIARATGCPIELFN
jgi:hypothetical protein